MSEAAATWQWNNFLEGQAALGQVVVHINLDETCVKLCPSVPRGAVAIDGGSTKKEALEQERLEPFAWQTQLRRHRLQTPQSRTKFLYSHTAPAVLKKQFTWLHICFQACAYLLTWEGTGVHMSMLCGIWRVALLT